MLKEREEVGIYNSEKKALRSRDIRKMCQQ